MTGIYVYKCIHVYDNVTTVCQCLQREDYICLTEKDRRIERQIEIQTDIQRDRGTGRLAGRQAGRQTDRQTDRHTHEHTRNTETNTDTHRHTDIQRERERERERDIQCHTENWRFTASRHTHRQPYRMTNRSRATYDHIRENIYVIVLK